MDKFEPYLITYGYFAIFIFIFFGIVGIPSPEESFLLFVGIALSQGSLNLYISILIAFLGAFSGMLTSYFIGYYIGKPFIYKYGKYIGLTKKRWHKARLKFNKYAIWAVAFGYFIPGVRQINPYMAGVSRYRFFPYAISAAIGGAVWTATFVLLGYFLGNKIHKIFSFTPLHIAIAAGFFFLIFLIITGITIWKIRRGRN
ncbi:membrane protein DedA with SNARE-associated domain [Scopulibacillus darangshiensis]|uniref:Membrane protein DedA with SNARE-associated domain n=1 Tax=Scopulibacillus darangshiensis TaxID=442528 RepID=A0A4R2NFF7_9BACL|nr:DedA family protein [Scopulibacillus darangshiensis]TCP19980.1 membrane protein DedA with SNARE-associated domain [Scopulibacillus darangshiensis]